MPSTFLGLSARPLCHGLVVRFGLGVGVVHADGLVHGSVVDGASLARAGPLDGALEEVSALDCGGLAVGQRFVVHQSQQRSN